MCDEINLKVDGKKVCYSTPTNIKKNVDKFPINCKKKYLEVPN